ncbi:hypothetical protein [Actinomadura madurae]|uniref:hypothetical protein n=1 Tax=Actinomadura madurae TaxID=1993 RepID=UPI0020D25A94|nr:hypothetical protein [Actinomadura madurae]MCQ0013548.1 hypothetical protein [Actinomadura madurae]
MHGLLGGHPAAVRGDEVVALADDLDVRAVQQDPAVFGHQAVHPFSGRSNQTCTWPVPTEFSYALYSRPGAVQARSPRAPIIIR